MFFQTIEYSMRKDVGHDFNPLGSNFLVHTFEGALCLRREGWRSDLPTRASSHILIIISLLQLYECFLFLLQPFSPPPVEFMIFFSHVFQPKAKSAHFTFNKKSQFALYLIFRWNNWSIKEISFVFFPRSCRARVFPTDKPELVTSGPEIFSAPTGDRLQWL